MASTEAVSYDLSRGLPTGIFDYARFIFVQYVRIALQCKPDVKLSYVILCWINPCLSLSLLFHNYQKVFPDTAVPKLKIHDSEIERLTEFNFLGLTINEYIDWTSHSNKIAHKISRTLGVMNRLKHELPYNALKTIYNSLILSHVQFNITAWGYDFNRIFKLQKRTLRIMMTCTKCNAHTDPIYKKLMLLKIQDMFIINADIHPYGTRQSSHLHYGITRTAKARKCIRYSLPILIDNTSQDILDKVGTHSIDGFSFYVKTRTIEDYASICHIGNCYMCKRDNR